MLIKCICTNCAGHLEFEEGNEGTTIPCPHCGFKTTLTLPGADQAESEAATRLKARLFRAALIIVASVALFLAAIGYALYRWVVPWLQDTYPSITSPVAPWAVAILACLAAPFLLFWLIFPVVVILELHYLNASVARLVERVGTEGLDLEEEEQGEGSSEEEPEPVVEAEEESSGKN